MKTAIFFMISWLTIGTCHAVAPPSPPPQTVPQPPRVAVIGGGGAGLTTAWLLDQDFDVTLYEKENRLGGHANTINVTVDNQTYPIDAGFEFFNDEMYSYFNRLLKILQVPLHQFPLVSTFYWTDGSETLVLPPIHDGTVTWHSLTPSHIFEELQFKHVLSEAQNLVDYQDSALTFKQFADSLTLTNSFKQDFLYPFVAAAWGVPVEVMQTFTAYNVLKYLVKSQPVGLQPVNWNEIVGGTISYVNAIANQFQRTTVKLSSTITNIKYKQGRYQITEADGTSLQFDHVVLATNAAQAKDLLQDITETLDIRTILGGIQYHLTTIAIHGDTRFMPQEQCNWTVSNIRYNGTLSANTFYKPWLEGASPIFKSWISYDVRPDNDSGNAMPSPLYGLVHYWHPVSDVKYYQVQKAVQTVSGNRNLWFAGIYTEDVDAHESAIVSAMRIGRALAPNSARLQQLSQLEE